MVSVVSVLQSTYVESTLNNIETAVAAENRLEWLQGRH